MWRNLRSSIQAVIRHQKKEVKKGQNLDKKQRVLDDVKRASKEGEKERWSKGYRHQEVDKIITITVIVEKVEEKKKKGVYRKNMYGRMERE